MKNSFLFIVLIFLASAAVISWRKETAAVKITSVARPDLSVTNQNYIGNKAPLQPLSFIKLPVSSIRPDGWLKKYLELQRNGLTGHLGEISAWLDKTNNAWYSGNGTGDHGWEEVPYWLKGYGDMGYVLRDTAIIKETRRWLEKAFQSQRPDGYFGPAIKENEHQDNKGSTPDLWPNMLMLWCMQSYYEYSGDKRVLSFMDKYFDWEMKLPNDQFLQIYWENSRGGDNLYSVYWLYNITGQKKLLDLAEKIHRNTADWTQQNNLPNWHNVNIAQCFREPATYYMQTKDAKFLQATYNDFNLIRTMYGQVPGGMFGADENARKGYTDPHQAVETCGMVEQMASDEILSGITGDPMWAENCEDVAFNTYPAAVMPDFRGLRYLTAPNMVVSDSKNHSPGIQNDGPFLMMNPFSSRCCQHNHAQGWPYYSEHLFMASPDNGLAAMLYSSATVSAKVANGNNVTVKEETNYPFDEKIKFTITSSKASTFPFYLRIPSWCSGALVYVNGELQKNDNKPGTYTRIEKAWNGKDVVELDLPMHIEVREWKANKNSVSVNYGPLTYSLLIKEDYKKMDSKASAIGDSHWQANVDESKWPSFEIYPASAWNYGLLLNKDTASSFSVVKKAWPKDNFPFTQASVPIEIKAKGKQIPNWKIDQHGLCDTLPQSPVNVSTAEENITLIPMGAARLRISSFPVIKN